MSKVELTVQAKETAMMSVHESVSPYGEMMKLLKEYIDKEDTITYCDSLPDTGETDHLYIVRTGEAYIYEGEWIQLTGGGTSGITGISVNGTPQEVINHVVDLLIKTSDLENDSGYITDDALEGYAKETDIPTKTSDLDNDSGYITNEALDGYAKTEDIPTELSDLKNDMGYITEDALDGYALEDEIPTKVSQLDNDADYTTVEATKAEIAEQIAEIVAGAPESLDTLKEIADWIEHHEDDAAAMNTAIKEAKETADSALTEAEAVKDSIPTKVSELDNDAGYVDSDALDEVKQTADDKVNSVKVGTVTTGDSPSVTNSGTDKDVVMDFVFPKSGGGSGFTIETFSASDCEVYAGEAGNATIKLDDREPVALLNAWSDDGNASYVLFSATSVYSGSSGYYANVSHYNTYNRDIEITIYVNVLYAN